MHIAGGSVFLLQGRRKIFQGGAGQGREQNPLGMAGQQSNSGHFQGGAGQGMAGHSWKFSGQGGPGQPIFPGLEWGGAGRASLVDKIAS